MQLLLQDQSINQLQYFISRATSRLNTKLLTAHSNVTCSSKHFQG